MRIKKWDQEGARRGGRTLQKPKGPFRTKNSTAPESVVFCYGRSFLLSVLFSGFFFLEDLALLSTLRSVFWECKNWPGPV